MFDIGFSELLVVFVVGLLILGPERLPHAAKTAGLWVRKIRRSINSVQREINAQLDQEELQQKIDSHKLEHSFIGITGRAIEPAIRPLGYDWKIGIAIVSSFAAREVFVGTLATIYSVENEDVDTITNRMAKDTNRITGGKLFTLASGVSLLLFYAFAMQCMSTLAIVKRETNSWKWPMLQLVIMSAFAYLVALVAFQIMK